MTTTEARAALIAHDPEVTCCISELAWHNKHYLNPEDRTRVEYNIVVFIPNCVSVDGKDLEQLLTQAKELIDCSKVQIPPLFSHATN